ncbi:hypothetical protein Celaphus_00006220, partial [Cervus elaphus hippelaphus]
FCKLPSPAGAEIAGKRPLRPAHPQRWSPRPTIALSATRVRLRRRLVRGFPATFLSRGIVPFLWFRGLCGRGAETAERNWISPLRVQPGGGGELKQNEPSLCCEVFDENMFGRLTFPQLLFASLLGIAGGIYIYQPIFEQYSRDQKELKEKMKLVQDSEEKK